MESNISRDHLAMEAMKVLLDNGVAISAKPITFSDKVRKFLGLPYNGEVQDNYIKEISKGAYEIADAMIAERDKDKEE